MEAAKNILQQCHKTAQTALRCAANRVVSKKPTKRPHKKEQKCIITYWKRYKKAECMQIERLTGIFFYLFQLLKFATVNRFCLIITFFVKPIFSLL